MIYTFKLKLNKETTRGEDGLCKRAAGFYYVERSYRKYLCQGFVNGLFGASSAPDKVTVKISNKRPKSGVWFRFINSQYLNNDCGSFFMDFIQQEYLYKMGVEKNKPFWIKITAA